MVTALTSSQASVDASRGTREGKAPAGGIT